MASHTAFSMLSASMLCALAAVVSADKPLFSERLFEASLPTAMKSLNSRFILMMANGTLPKSAFARYLHQDNLYLIKYARAFAVLGARVSDNTEFTYLVNRSIGYLNEHGLTATRHLDEHIFEREALPVTVAYTSFALQAAWSQSPLLTYAAVLPCQRLYDWLFSRLKATHNITDDNPYKPYIDQYADPRNRGVTIMLEKFLNRHAAGGVSKEEAFKAHFNYERAMRYEVDFFEQGLSYAGSFQARNLHDSNGINSLSHMHTRNGAWPEYRQARGLVAEEFASGAVSSPATFEVSKRSSENNQACMIAALGIFLGVSMLVAGRETFFWVLGKLKHVLTNCNANDEAGQRANPLLAALHC